MQLAFVPADRKPQDTVSRSVNTSFSSLFFGKYGSLLGPYWCPALGLISTAPSGMKDYAAQKLVTELRAAFLCGDLDIKGELHQDVDTAPQGR